MTDQRRPGSGSPSGGGRDGIEGLRVLYAEDHPEMRRALVRLLQVSGASVTSAEDGSEATEKALAETFDVVVMDVRMPRMDGFAAARAMRAGGCRAPLVAVSADASSEVLANALAAGFDAVLPKPFGLAELIRALELVREAAAFAARAARPDSSPP